jgi:hypothetical protein
MYIFYEKDASVLFVFSQAVDFIDLRARSVLYHNYVLQICFSAEYEWKASRHNFMFNQCNLYHHLLLKAGQCTFKVYLFH